MFLCSCFCNDMVGGAFRKATMKSIVRIGGEGSSRIV